MNCECRPVVALADRRRPWFGSGGVRLSGVSRVPVQPTLGFACFSSFLDLEKSCLGAQHS
jgi:hypothetical protein